MNFDITSCSGIKNILTDTLSRFFWSYNTLVESGNKRLSKNYINRKNLIKQDIDTNGKGKRKNVVDNNMVKEKKRGTYSLLIRGKIIPKKHMMSLFYVYFLYLRFIKSNHSADLLNDTKLTAYTNNLKNKNEEVLFCVSDLNVYKTPENNEDKQNILEKIHLLGHSGIHAMEQVIHQDLNMHWKGLREDITKYTSNRHKCRQFNLAKHVYHPPKQEATEGIIDRVVFELDRFDCTTTRGNKFILVALGPLLRLIIL